MPMRSELPICASLPRLRASGWKAACAWIVAMINCPEFLMMALFSTVGLWLIYGLQVFLPDFGELVVSLNQFP
jgi:hypothetical protein